MQYQQQNWSLFAIRLSLEIFHRDNKHPKALPIFLLLVLVMRKMSPRQALKIPMLDLVSCSPTVVYDHFMHRYIGYSVQQDPNTDIQSEIAAGHNAKLHIKPTWNGKDQCKEIIPLKEPFFRLMMVAVNGPRESMHHVLVRKPRHELHEPEGSQYPEYVDENFQSTKF